MKGVLAWIIIVLAGATAFVGVFILAELMVAFIYGTLR
jgi:hypothetical protein